MRGLTTVARLPGSGNGRHAALEAQDFGKAAKPSDTKACSDERLCTACFSDDGPCTGTSLAEDAQRMLARIEDEVRASVTDLLAGKTMTPELQAQVAQGISAAIDAHIAGIADATGLTVGQLTGHPKMGDMVWTGGAPVKPLTLTFRLSDLSDEERARFEEDMRLSAPISVGYDIGREFEHQYMQRPRPMTECALARFRPDDVAFLKANGVKPDHVFEMYRDEEAATTRYRVAGDERFDSLVRDHAKPDHSFSINRNGVRRIVTHKEPEPRYIGKRRVQGRYEFTDVKASISGPGDQFVSLNEPKACLERHTAIGKDLDVLAINAAGLTRRPGFGIGPPETDAQFRARLNEALGF